VVKPGTRLPFGIDYANIVAHVTFQGNPLGVNSEHVYYLERETDFPLGTSTTSLSSSPSSSSTIEGSSRSGNKEGDYEYHMSCITALCTADDVMIPHPEAIFEATMTDADEKNIPIR
jgi:hypothetical protein